MYDLIIQNGLIADGSGIPAFCGDVAVKNGMIFEVAGKINAEAFEIINAAGCVVAPGFIDIHRHADTAVFKPGFGNAELSQGITTIINGNCGLSVAPLSTKWREEILRYLRPITGNLPEEIKFNSFAEYLNEVEILSLPLNVGMLVGSGTIRMASAGLEKNTLEKSDYKLIHKHLQNAIEAGAFGVSLGLAYTPDNKYNADTLTKALAPIAGSKIPLAAHIRGEGNLLIDSLEEVISVAKSLNIPLHVSHLKAVGTKNWGHSIENALGLLNSARDKGISVTCDVYPWTAGSTQLIQLLPPEYLQGGMGQIVKRLKDPKLRNKCKEILEKPQDYFENLLNLIGWENIMVSTKDYALMPMTEIAETKGEDPCDCAFDMIIETEGNIPMVNFIACEKDIETILCYPHSFITSDSVYPEFGVPHPRRFGTFPKILGEYVRQKKILSLEQAINKFTAAPAQKFAIKNKGLIKKGYDADIVIFDPNKIGSGANYAAPETAPIGVKHVLVAGGRGKAARRFNPSVHFSSPPV